MDREPIGTGRLPPVGGWSYHLRKHRGRSPDPSKPTLGTARWWPGLAGGISVAALPQDNHVIELAIDELGKLRQLGKERGPLFEKPNKEHFVHMLASIVEESQVRAAQEVSELQREFEKALNPAAGYTEALCRALLPIHKDRVARAMELVVDVARQSGLDLNDLCTTAEHCLKTHVGAIASLVVRAPFVSPTVQASLTASVPVPFVSQIDEGVRAVRVGYIRERSIAMPAAETVQAKALRMLQVIYERTQSGNGGIDIEEVRGLLGMSLEDASAGWTYLTDKNLITRFTIPTVARINAQGVDAIEAAKSQPDKTTSIFPSVTYNTINVHHMVSSTIQQGGAGATMTTTSYSVEAVENLGKLVTVFESRLGELNLDEAKERAARTQVATIKVQLADEPDPVIVNQAGRTLRNITEGAIGSLVATAAQPGIWHWVQGVMAVFGP
jgi:hypothetical protein